MWALAEYAKLRVRPNTVYLWLIGEVWSLSQLALGVQFTGIGLGSCAQDAPTISAKPTTAPMACLANRTHGGGALGGLDMED
jgi:hypothetical protein